MQLGDKRHYVRNMFNNMTADYLVKFISGERIGKHTKVMNDVGVTPRIGIDADGAGVFVLATTNIEDFL